MKDNRIRVLSEIIAIDAWHQPIKIDGSTASVHVELTFKQGRIGGDDDRFPFTFRISVKKAFLTIHLESPLEADRKTIARNIPEAEVEYSRYRQARENAAASLKGGARLTPALVQAHLSASANKEKSVEMGSEMKISQTLPQTLVTYEPVDPSQFRWSLVPIFDDDLNGQPWNPIEKPRLSVRSRETKTLIDPAIRIDLTCSMEDIEISDIKPKQNPKITDRIKEFVFADENLVAATQHIKLLLKEADLEAGKLDNRFSQMMIASVIAMEDKYG